MLLSLNDIIISGRDPRPTMFSVHQVLSKGEEDEGYTEPVLRTKSRRDYPSKCRKIERTSLP
jgi:hypothetical protein